MPDICLCSSTSPFLSSLFSVRIQSSFGVIFYCTFSPIQGPDQVDPSILIESSASASLFCLCSAQLQVMGDSEAARWCQRSIIMSHVYHGAISSPDTTSRSSCERYVQTEGSVHKTELTCGRNDALDGLERLVNVALL